MTTAYFGQFSAAPVFGFAAAAAWTFIDLFTKAQIGAWLSLEMGAHRNISPFLNLTLSYNRGVTFGLFSVSVR